MLKNISVLNFITIIFVVLKLCNVIHWNWVLVLLSTIINIGVWVLVYSIIGIVKLIEYIKSNKFKGESK